MTVPVIDSSEHACDDVDAQLLIRVRRGDDLAYGELWTRHAVAARRAAARLVPRADIEDLVSEAFERTLAAIRSGHGPESSFFPYVARTLRGRAATMLAAKAQVILAEDDAALDCPVEDADPFHGHPAKGRLVQAFQELPSRWQDALWVSVVEDEPPRRAAAFLGTSPNGVSAMVIRARRRLRANFIDLSAAESRNPVCRLAIQSPSRHAGHISSCEHCEATLAGLAELDVSLSSRGLPLAALMGAGLARVVAPHRRLRDFLTAMPGKVAAVALATAGVAVGPLPAGPLSADPSSDRVTSRRGRPGTGGSPDLGGGSRAGRARASADVRRPAARAPRCRASAHTHAPQPGAAPTPTPAHTDTVHRHRARPRSLTRLLSAFPRRPRRPRRPTPGTRSPHGPRRPALRLRQVTISGVNATLARSSSDPPARRSIRTPGDPLDAPRHAAGEGLRCAGWLRPLSGRRRRDPGQRADGPPTRHRDGRTAGRGPRHGVADRPRPTSARRSGAKSLVAPVRDVSASQPGLSIAPAQPIGET